jgi:hypothetical protein
VEEIDMKTLRIVLTCAAALVAAQAWAQDQPPPPASVQANQDMGGMTDAMSSAGGRANQPLTRQDVYQDLVRSEQSGQQAKLWKDIYRGN